MVHRALVRGEQTRMSFVSMIGPSLDTIVEQLARSAPQGMEFRGIKYVDYMEHQQQNKINKKGFLFLCPRVLSCT
jgi:hypothetical protein